jgi:hypothetical protein
MNSRTIVGMTLIAAFLALGTLVLTLTTHGVSSPPCPACGSLDTFAQQSGADATLHGCRSCKHWYWTEGQGGFSLWDSAEELLGGK